MASEPGWRVAGKEEVGVAESLEALEELVVATVVEEVGGSSLQGRSLCTPQPRTLPLCTSSRIFSMRRGKRCEGQKPFGFQTGETETLARYPRAQQETTPRKPAVPSAGL